MRLWLKRKVGFLDYHSAGEKPLALHLQKEKSPKLPVFLRLNRDVGTKSEKYSELNN